jgi:hypothetical protein
VKAFLTPSFYLPLGVLLVVLAFFLWPQGVPPQQNYSVEQLPIAPASSLEITAQPPASSARPLTNGPAAFATSPASAEDVALLNEQPDFLPEEWEDSFFEIFEDSSQTMQVRNGKLMDLATNDAAGVPSVQRAALLHLAFGIPDDEVENFARLLKSRNIPLDLRLQLLSTVANFRPESLVRDLAQDLSSHDELEVATAARLLGDEFNRSDQ